MIKTIDFIEKVWSGRQDLNLRQAHISYCNYNNNILLVAIKRHFVIFLVIVSLLLLSSCATTFKPVCRHNAILAALTVGEKYPVRLVWGNVSGNWQNHVQAQALIDGQWRWLDVIGGTVQIGDQDNYNAWNVMTVRDFIDFEWSTGVK